MRSSNNAGMPRTSECGAFLGNQVMTQAGFSQRKALFEEPGPRDGQREIRLLTIAQCGAAAAGPAPFHSVRAGKCVTSSRLLYRFSVWEEGKGSAP